MRYKLTHDSRSSELETDRVRSSLNASRRRAADRPEGPPSAVDPSADGVGEELLADGRVVLIALAACLIGLMSTAVAKLLILAIALTTNLAFRGEFSTVSRSPWTHHLGVWVVWVPAVGGLIVGAMARFGSSAIRGHGIPEAMEQVLTNSSKIHPKLTLLKPISSAIAIGTGGPFGAEGPIIATGGALGSMFGQLLHTTSDERKCLLAAGAAAGMTAIFGSPVSAVILAVELLLFEVRASSLIPVGLACAVAAGARSLCFESGPVFRMGAVATPSIPALASYLVLGAAIGVIGVGVTRVVYQVEDWFDRLPIHWMFWPAIGGLVVGAIGFFVPRTLGVGYENISGLLNGRVAVEGLLLIAVAKFVSWAVALGSGTSGGTLAPLLTIGGSLSAGIGMIVATAVPWLGVDPRIAGLVGMAAIFSSASRAVLTSIFFAFETTLQPVGILPVLLGSLAAYLASCLLMRETIMTEKISRRGVSVPREIGFDHLALLKVSAIGLKPVVTLSSGQTVLEAVAWISRNVPEASHQGFPVLDEKHQLVGVVTRRDLLVPTLPLETLVRDRIRRASIVVFSDQTVRDAMDLMVSEDVGRLPVVQRLSPGTVVGILTRSDLLEAGYLRIYARQSRERHLQLR